MNTHLHSNLQLILNGEQPELKWLTQLQDINSSFQTSLSKSGAITAEKDGTWLASRYQPQKEGQRFATSQNIQEDDFIILYGFGLGYHLLPILEKIGEKGFLYVIELNLEILKTALSSNDLSLVLSDPRLKILTSQNQEMFLEIFDQNIRWGLETIPDHQKKVMIHEGSFQFIPRDYFWVKNALELIKFERRGDQAFFEEQRDNIIANLHHLSAASPILCLDQLLLDHPCALVGAGPSLDQSISLLRTYQDQMFIFAVDTALIPLLKEGIEPDFVVSIDPQNQSIRHFKGAETIDLNLILLLTSSSKVSELPHKHKFFVTQEGTWFQQFIDRQLDYLGLTYGGGAVSVIALDIILRYGHGPTFLFGMDYSFPNLQSYAYHTPMVNKWKQRVTPYYSLTMASIEHIQSRPTVFIEGYLDTPVPTFQSLISYLRSLENIIKVHSQRELFTLCPQGAKIQGVQAILFEEEINEYLHGPISKEKNFPLIAPQPTKDLDFLAKIDSLKSLRELPKSY